MKKWFLLPLFLLACSSGLEARCYEIVGDPDGTQLILEEDGSNAKLTITDPVGGQPVEVMGRLEDGAFVYDDGTLLNYNAEKAWYSNNDFLVGIEGTAVTCD